MLTIACLALFQSSIRCLSGLRCPQAYTFEAAAEQLRPPRVVRIGLIQHGMVAPTTAPFEEQRQVAER